MKIENLLTLWVIAYSVFKNEMEFENIIHHYPLYFLTLLLSILFIHSKGVNGNNVVFNDNFTSASRHPLVYVLETILSCSFNKSCKIIRYIYIIFHIFF